MLGYPTLSYLAFCLMDFGLPVDGRVDNAQEICAVMAVQDGKLAAAGIHDWLNTDALNRSN